MSKVDKKYIVQLQGQDFVKYEGLLDVAHQEGLVSIETELIELPNSSNNGRCVFKTITKTQDKTFFGYGDADSNNVNKMIAKHVIRMAETRAKARALRDLTNIGMTAVEEMGGEEHQEKPKKQAPKKTPKPSHEDRVKRVLDAFDALGVDQDTLEGHLDKPANQWTDKEFDELKKYYDKLK